MKNRDDLLELKNIHKNYEGASLLKGINFQVGSGETFCLLGRSGSGKSTLLRIIAGLETADSGDVLWNGQNMNGIPTFQRNFGLMFQDYALFPHMKVSENVAFGLRMQGKPREEIAAIMKSTLELVNMSQFSDRNVTDLSGGEQQRIALARALAPQPRLLMLDEPLAALDRALRMELQEELRSLLHKAGIPVIYVTHDQEEALLLADHVAILADGVIKQMGRPEEVYQAPRNRKVAEFLGMTNFVEGKVVSLEPLIVRSDCGEFQPGVCQRQSVHVGEKVILLIKPVAFLTTDEKKNNIISGEVKECVYRGEDYKVKIQTCNSSMVFFFTIPQTIDKKIHLRIEDESVICLGE